MRVSLIATMTGAVVEPEPLFGLVMIGYQIAISLSCSLLLL